jgi:hypothetical protein
VVAARQRQVGDDLAEVAAAPADQDGARGHRRSPRSTHHRMLARMPSTSPTAGS